MKEVKRERQVYLVETYEMDNQQENILRRYSPFIFEQELDGWILDETIWPEKRDYETFNRWFDAELHSVVIDLCDEPIEYEE